MTAHKPFLILAATLLATLPTFAAGPARPASAAFVQKHCVECHDADTTEGDLDLTALSYNPADPKNFAQWVKVHDRVVSGEMPPKKKPRPAAAELKAFLEPLAVSLAAADDANAARDGRATQRRMNRYEYENAVRDLLHAPWLQIRDTLPEDGEAGRFNKVGDALDVSHVQVARYLAAADYALRQVAATQADRPETKTTRYYTRDQRSFAGKMKFSFFNTRPERATFPVLGEHAEPAVRKGEAPSSNPKTREQEAVGVVASTYEPLEITFNNFKAPVAGHYKLRFKTWTVWAGPGKPAAKGKPTETGKPAEKADRWYIPDLDDVSKGRRDEPVTVYAETPPRLLRHLGKFDAQVEPGVAELDVYLLAGETIRPDAARLFRSRPSNWINPLAEKDGCPGVAFAWMEAEGPIYDQWPTAGHKLLFDDLPLTKSADGGVTVDSQSPASDARRLLRNFMSHAYRGGVGDAEVERFAGVVDTASRSGSNFTDAMIAGYTAVLCSPRFVCLEEKPGRLDDWALASRLSFFLWNTAPDGQLRALAANGELHRADMLHSQVERLLGDPRSKQFVDAFLDYWLDLRKIVATAPDGTLYNDYYLDDLLSESALDETQLFVAELIKGNFPARNLVASDFAILNEKLATHYGIPGVQGVAMRKVALPPDSVRGGLLTQTAVLKVTANGTTTSPVIRGAWIMERILGQPVPPPPPGTPAVEPDTRGAVTIRQQLEKHRAQPSCNVCHAKIDPAGFALESFDVMGGFRDHYRAVDPALTVIAPGAPAPAGVVPGIGKNGQRFVFHDGPPVDAGGELPDGRKFKDVRELKQFLLADQRQVARNLARQLVVYATGAPVRFGDRARIEAILDRAKDSQYGVRTLIHEIVQSDLFLKK